MLASWSRTAAAGSGALVAVLLLSALQAAGFALSYSAAGAALLAVLTVASERIRARNKPTASNAPAPAAQRPAPEPTQRADELAHAAADALPDAMVLYSDSGLIRYSNPAARALFFEGSTPEGKNFIRLVSAAPLALREALLGENDRLFAVQVDGWRESYHLSRRQCLVFGEAHTLLLVKHMTREMGRREVEVLKRVVRVISHEVNNSLAPIASLVNSARLIGKRPEHADKLDRALNTIEERAQHLGTFLEGYTRLAKLPAPAPKRVPWAPLLEQLSNLYPRLQRPAAPAEAGWFDAVQLEQVLVNLIKNAIEAGSPEDGVQLAVEVGADGASEIHVLDSGSGFTEEAQKQALLPLYTTKEHGSGMGLALSSEIVEAHGGSLALSNRPEGGAWIRIVLPGRATDVARDLTRSRLTLAKD